MRDMARAQAARDLAEALRLSGGEPLPPAGPTQPPGPLPAPLQPRPPGMPQRPQGALAMGGPPQQQPPISPLQMTQSFKSPPMAAALQGAVGREGPIGFADGGFVVVRR